MLQKQCIRYLGPIERAGFEVIIKDGKLVYKQTGKYLDTVDGSKYIFVLATLKNLYAGEKKKGQFQHSSFLSGGAATAAGRLVAHNGILETVFFLWFALSGWLFRTIIFTTWVMPFAGPLLIGVVANNLVIKGSCPACKKQFVGFKNQQVQCSGYGNTVWQPKGDFFSKGSGGMPGTSKSKQDIIDVESEEK